MIVLSNLRFKYDAESNYSSQLQAHQIRPLLGIPAGKLPKDDLGGKMIGNTLVWVLSAWEAKQINPGIIRPHRVMAECADCRKVVPAGRLSQHRKMHKEA